MLDGAAGEQNRPAARPATADSAARARQQRKKSKPLHWSGDSEPSRPQSAGAVAVRRPRSGPQTAEPALRKTRRPASATMGAPYAVGYVAGPASAFTPRRASRTTVRPTTRAAVQAAALRASPRAESPERWLAGQWNASTEVGGENGSMVPAYRGSSQSPVNLKKQTDSDNDSNEEEEDPGMASSKRGAKAPRAGTGSL